MLPPTPPAPAPPEAPPAEAVSVILAPTVSTVVSALTEMVRLTLSTNVKSVSPSPVKLMVSAAALPRSTSPLAAKAPATVVVMAAEPMVIALALVTPIDSAAAADRSIPPSVNSALVAVMFVPSNVALAAPPNTPALLYWSCVSAPPGVAVELTAPPLVI